MREVIMHAQPSSGSMHLIFGPYVRPNGACLSRLLHIVDNFIGLCLYRGKLQVFKSRIWNALFSVHIFVHKIICPIVVSYFPVSVLASMHACAVCS